MAADYDVVSSGADVQVLGPTSILDVTRFGIQTKPSGVLVYVNVPQERVSESEAQVTLQAYALLVEAAMRLEGVVAMRPEQDVDASGLIADYMVVTVGVNSPAPDAQNPLTTDVRILTRYFGTSAGFSVGIGQPIAQALAGLEAAI